MDVHFRAGYDGTAVLAGVRRDDRELSVRAAQAYEIAQHAAAAQRHRRRERARRLAGRVDALARRVSGLAAATRVPDGGSAH